MWPAIPPGRRVMGLTPHRHGVKRGLLVILRAATHLGLHNHVSSGMRQTWTLQGSLPPRGPGRVQHGVGATWHLRHYYRLRLRWLRYRFLAGFPRILDP